jgi:ATP-dependent Clp protease ATP-binding subunit ClpA
MVGISTNQEWDHAFANDAAFDQRFEEVNHAAPTGEDLRQKIRNSFTLRGLPVPENEAIERAISLSDRFAITGAQPRKAVNLLIKATGIMDEFGRENHSATREAVERAAVETYHIDPATFDRAKIHARLSSMQSTLQSQIVGQRQAIEKINQVWFRKLSGVGSEQTANAILFYGPPGTGKTLTAKLSAQAGGYKSTVIEMNKYASGDIEAFRYEVFRALRESPNTVLVLDEFEKAHPRVQNATLAMMQPGQFTVNFQDHNGRRVFEEVTSKNAIFVLTTNAGQSLFSRNAARTPIGFKPAPANGAHSQNAVPSQAEVTSILVQDGISEPVLSRVEAVVGLPRPHSEEFKIAIEREIDSTLARESKRTGVNFRLTGKSLLVERLMQSYQPNSSDYRDVGYLVRENLDPLIAQAIIEPDFEKARVVEIKWSSNIDPKALPSSTPCDFLARKINRPLSSLGKK